MVAVHQYSSLSVSIESIKTIEAIEAIEQNKPAHDITYFNKAGRTILLALEEILGRSSMNAMLHQIGLKGLINRYPPANYERQFNREDYTRLIYGLEAVYGRRSSRGMLVQVGHALFRSSIEEFRTVGRLFHGPLKLLPATWRAWAGLNIIAALSSRFLGGRMRVDELPDSYIFLVEDCPIRDGRHSEQPVCYLIIGMLQAGLAWFSGGRVYQVELAPYNSASNTLLRFIVNKTKPAPCIRPAAACVLESEA